MANQGWRWRWMWTTTFLAVNNLVLVCFFFEETKYIPNRAGRKPEEPRNKTEESKPQNASYEHLDQMANHPSPEAESIVPRPNPLSKRLAIITNPMSPSGITSTFLFKILFTFPCCCLRGHHIRVTTRLVRLGLFMISALIGAILGTIVGAPLNDQSILWLARRNGGIFEPEMRLWMGLPGSLVATAGVLTFGLGLSRSLPWVVLAVGYAIFGFGFSVTGDIALTYLTDCYPEILGDVLVGVVFIRNGLSVLIMSVYTPWISSFAIQNTFICAAIISLAMTIMPIGLLIWGKRARERTAPEYRDLLFGNLFSKV
ncbi:hypothetical protein N7467_005294 [Penicillium canescens]|nr:hypothetical protein N7467_005294 [Penicillium canescens]